MTALSKTLLALAVVAGLTACAAPPRPAPPPPAPLPVAPAVSAPVPERPSFTQRGGASWYGNTHHGRRTANGETFDMNQMTAAHRELAFGTVVRVTRLDDGRTVKVRINDRGPYAGSRIIDLSARAARDLGIAEDGVAQVKIERFAADQ